MSAAKADSSEREALLIVAHGDRGGTEDNRLALSVAERLRETGGYAGVAVGYVRGHPALQEAAAELGAARLRVYPLFMSDGYYVKKAIPERLGVGEEGAPEVRIEPPIGVHPDLPGLLADAAARTVREAEKEPTDHNLLLVAHGSSKSSASADAAAAVGDEIRAQGRFREVTLAFLEEPPFLDDALASAAGPLCVLGLFVGQGMHGGEDLPRAIRSSKRDDVVLAPALADIRALADLICAELAAPL